MAESLAGCWLAAAEDLGIRVAAPFQLLDASGSSVEFDAHIVDFGGARGLVVMNVWEPEKAALAQRSGYGYSCLAGAAYDRDSTIEVLRDWGWSGVPASEPSWLRP
jgi:hypothetical protein